MSTERLRPQPVQETLGPIDIQGIMEMIPHRYPFLLIDRVESIVPHERAIGLKNVSINDAFFQGHFPEQPVMPGVLIIESMAQTAAVLVVKSLGSDAKGKLVYFTSIANARFRKTVVPGDAMKLNVTIRQYRKSLWKFQGEAVVDGELRAEATFAAMIMDH